MCVCVGYGSMSRVCVSVGYVSVYRVCASVWSGYMYVGVGFMSVCGGG